MKRAFDLIVALAALAVLAPVLLAFGVLIWLQDRHSPFYLGSRVGQGGTSFRMVKFRSMVVHADRTGVASTAGDDGRITRLGRIVRRLKVDELPQLWNVVTGDMSLVGPRPNVPTEVAVYTDVERGLLSVRPGVTDFASIVFADEGEILRGSGDPDRDYRLLIRPWKSRLGLHYVRRHSLGIDLRLLVLTAIGAVSRARALRGVQRLLVRTGAPAELIRVAGRSDPLRATDPPGTGEGARQQPLRYA